MDAPPGPAADLYVLKLYVSAATPRSVAALEYLRRICAGELRGRYRLEVIDVGEHPERAEQDKILATPTLIKRLPPPLRRLVGDLSDTEHVLLGLDLVPEITPPPAAPPASGDRDHRPGA